MPSSLSLIYLPTKLELAANGSFLAKRTKLSENLERDIAFVLSYSAPVQFADLTAGVKNYEEIRLVDKSRQYAGYFKARG